MLVFKIMRVMGIVALAISFLLSTGSIQNAWEDNNDKYFLLYAILIVSSLAGIIYMINI